MELQILELVFNSPAACPLLRASIRASTKGPLGGFGPRDPERDLLVPDAIAALYHDSEYPSSLELAADARLTAQLQGLLPEGMSLGPVLAAMYMRRVNPPAVLLDAVREPVYAAVLKRVLAEAGIVRIPEYPLDPSWVECEQSESCHYRITGPLLEISSIVDHFGIPEDVELGDVRHLVMYGEMNFVDGLLERLPNLETIAALDAGFYQKHCFEYLHRLGQARLPRLRTFVFDTIDLDTRHMNIDMVTCPRKVARSIDQVLQHQFNPFRTLATDFYGRAREDPGAHDGRLLVLVRHVVDHTEESFRETHVNAGIEWSGDDEYREEYVPFPGRITLLP
jgi:hypothetical protein